MTADQARVSIHVEVEPDEAFRVFTGEIDRWWLRGPRHRVAGKDQGILHLEPRAGGKLYESFGEGAGARVFATGEILVWKPPERLVFVWRSVTFVEGEATEVEVSFEPRRGGTQVTVTHRGWSSIRPDHPVRHGADEAAFLRRMGLWWADLLRSFVLVCRDPAAP